MDNDSVMQSTISSAASALLRQKTMASPISFFLGVNPRKISSNLSRCLNISFSLIIIKHNIPNVPITTAQRLGEVSECSSTIYQLPCSPHKN